MAGGAALDVKVSGCPSAADRGGAANSSSTFFALAELNAGNLIGLVVVRKNDCTAPETQHLSNAPRSAPDFRAALAIVRVPGQAIQRIAEAVDGGYRMRRQERAHSNTGLRLRLALRSRTASKICMPAAAGLQRRAADFDMIQSRTRNRHWPSPH